MTKPLVTVEDVTRLKQWLEKDDDCYVGGYVALKLLNTIEAMLPIVKWATGFTFKNDLPGKILKQMGIPHD